MKLDTPYEQQLYTALLKAFPKEVDLQRMVSFGLKENLAAIAGSGPLNDVVFKLVQWAAAQGRLKDLLSAARDDNPNNPELRALEDNPNAVASFTPDPTHTLRPASPVEHIVTSLSPEERH